MLLSIVLELRSERAGSLPTYLGRAAHSQALSFIAKTDGALAQAIHDGQDGSSAKPITCSSLLDMPPGAQDVRLAAGQVCAVRITTLSDAVGHALIAGLEDRLKKEEPLAWPLRGHPFTVTAALCNPALSRWSGSETYAELAQRHQLAPRPAAKVRLEFISPTAFKSHEVQNPLPLPGLVFGNLVERWNAFCPAELQLDPALRQYSEEAVVVSSFHLDSQVLPQKGSTVMIGAVGRVTYTALGGDRYWFAALQMLADYAFYSGVGMKTTMGMGQCRRVDPDAS